MDSTALEGKVALVGFSFSSVELPGATVQKEVAELTGGSCFQPFSEAKLSLSSCKEDEAIGSPLPPHKQSSYRDCAQQIPLITPQ